MIQSEEGGQSLSILKSLGNEGEQTSKLLPAGNLRVADSRHVSSKVLLSHLRRRLMMIVLTQARIKPWDLLFIDILLLYSDKGAARCVLARSLEIFSMFPSDGLRLNCRV